MEEISRTTHVGFGSKYIEQKTDSFNGFSNQPEDILVAQAPNCDIVIKEEDNDIDFNMNTDEINYVNPIKTETVLDSLAAESEDSQYFAMSITEEQISIKQENDTAEINNYNSDEVADDSENTENSSTYEHKYCEFRTEQRTNVTDHCQNTQEKTQYFKCFMCNYQSRYAYTLKMHLRIKHPGYIEWHRCHLCPFKSQQKAAWKRHLANQHNQTVQKYHGNICGFRSDVKSDLKQQPINDELKQCNFRIGDLKCSDSTHSGDSKWLYCHACHFKTLFMKRLTIHMKQKHELNVQENVECGGKVKLQSSEKQGVIARYQCGHCDFSTRHRCSLVKHFNSKHNENPELYQCHDCDRKFKSKTSLASHSSLKHETYPEWYCCTKCTYMTKLKGSLKRHLQLLHKSEFDEDCQEMIVMQCGNTAIEEKQEASGWQQSQEIDPASILHCSITIKQENEDPDSQNSIELEESESVNSVKMHHQENTNGTGYNNTPFGTRNENYKLLNTIDMPSSVKDEGPRFGSTVQTHLLEAAQKSCSGFKDLKDVQNNYSQGWYRCHVCTYQTKYKNNLIEHFSSKQANKNNESWGRFKCHLCNYKTMYKYNLKGHLANDH